MSGNFFGGGPPAPGMPPRPRRWVAIRRPIRGTPVKLILLANSWLPSYHHWDEDGTHACVGRCHGCPWCLRGSIARWTGHLPAHEELTRRDCICEVTSACVWHSPKLTAACGKLYGQRITLGRINDRPTGRLVCYALEEVSSWPKGRTFDLLPILSAIWRVGGDKLDQVLATGRDLSLVEGPDDARAEPDGERGAS